MGKKVKYDGTYNGYVQSKLDAFAMLQECGNADNTVWTKLEVQNMWNYLTIMDRYVHKMKRDLDIQKDIIKLFIDATSSTNSEQNAG